MDRRWWLAGVGAALAGPYLALDGNLPGGLQASRDQMTGRSAATAAANPWDSSSQVPSWSEPSSEMPQMPAVTLEEALRIDVHPEWVISRWPRVATNVGEVNWSGMRVPLVTGLSEDDFTGSLTYYFDRNQELQRISLDGYCGNEQRIVAIATQNFGLTPEGSLGAGLYVYRWNREPLSVLSVQYAPVVSADAPQMKRRIQLEFNRPSPGWKLSPHLKALASPSGW